MTKRINNNIISLKIKENYGQMIAYLYLMIIEYVSNGLFVPSINPPTDNIFVPSNFIDNQYTITYFKTVKFQPKADGVNLVFSSIDDANEFYTELERTW
jgi:hypothetical protein